MSEVFYKCPVCKHKVTEKSRLKQTDIEKTGGRVIKKEYYMIGLSCNHICIDPPIWIDDVDAYLDSFISLDGKTLFPFQREGVKFLLKNGKGLIADEMGLGKTIQAIATIMSNPKQFLPALVICKSAITLNWVRQIVRWSGAANNDVPIISQIISTSKGEVPMLNIFPITIISYDLLRRLDWPDERWSAYRTVILDEVQQIKRSGAKDTKRASAVMELIAKIPHVIALSGTPFKNTLFEYYNVLHALKPDRFPGFNNFLWRFVDVYKDRKGTTKYGGLRKGTEKEFIRLTEDIVIRRERKEVAPEIPTVNRQFQFCDLDKNLENAYRKLMIDFSDAYYRGEKFNNILEYINKMRYLTTMSKIDNTVDTVSEALLTSDEQIVVFYHHDDAGEAINRKLTELMTDGDMIPPLRYVSSLSDQQRDIVVQDFRNKKSRVLLCSTLAGGEGIDLEFCHRAVMHERQWNPGNEEQAESRFTRFGSTAEYVDVIYQIAAGTIDDYFTELVEVKRERFRKGMNKEAQPWNETGLMQELFEVLATKGMKQWRL
jgi:SNF2 family DNA or RNA helicase